LAAHRRAQGNKLVQATNEARALAVLERPLQFLDKFQRGDVVCPAAVRR
jgi:hypothetical protein